VIVGNYMNCIALIGTAFLEYTDGDLFLYCFSFFWLLFGVGFSFASTANLSIVAKLYKENLAKAIGLFDTFAAIGLVLGPVVGSLCFYLFNFKGPFLVLGSTFVIYGFVIERLLSTGIDTNFNE